MSGRYANESIGPLLAVACTTRERRFQRWIIRMNRFSIRCTLVPFCAAILFLGLPHNAAGQSCNQTLSVGANVASAIANAPADSTICLNSGNYGTLNVSNANRTSFVTVRSTTGVGATFSMDLISASWIRFQSLTIAGADMTGCPNHIEVRNSTFTAGLLISTRGVSCPQNLNLVVDGNTFGDLGPATYEGRISVVDDDGLQPSMGLTISNNKIGPGCRSDGIQLAGGASGVTIGPGNTFDGIVQSGSIHCDMIQFYGNGQNNTIVGNWFKNGSTVLTHHTLTPVNTVFRNNVISNVSQFQVGTSVNFVFEHNTVNRISEVFSIIQGPNNIIRSNIIINGVGLSTTGCTGCTISYNLCNASCTGTNQIIGTPSFVGGTSPSTMSGWQLTTTSIGRNAGHDGKDVGVLLTTPVMPTAPTNLRVTP